MTNQVANKSEPLVSVIIPVYNAADLISDALNSVINQNYNNTEIIIINDGSTDDLLEKARAFNDNIILFSQENKGISAARNFGLNKAQGKYIQFLDADDLLLNNKLIEQVNFLEKHSEFDMVYSEVLHFTTNKTKGQRFYYYNYQGDAMAEILKFHYPAIHSPLFRKKALDSVGGFDENFRFAEDWDLWLRLVINKTKFGHLDGDFSLCRIEPRPHRLSDNKYKLFRSCLDVFQKNRASLELDHRYETLIKNLEYYLYLRLGIVAIIDHYDDGKRYLAEAVRCSRGIWRSLVALSTWWLGRGLPKKLAMGFFRLLAEQSMVYKLKTFLR